MNTDKINSKDKPIIYSCSGCSDIAQLANYIAVTFDRMGEAEMSCISGVGGGVKPLVKKAQSGRIIVALDGCPLHCSKHCLENANVASTLHYTLTDFGIKKVYHKDFNPDDAKIIIDKIMDDLNELKKNNFNKYFEELLVEETIEL